MILCSEENEKLTTKTETIEIKEEDYLTKMQNTESLILKSIQMSITNYWSDS